MTTGQQLFVEFSDSTSMHGLRRAVLSEAKWKRPIWAILVLAGTVVAIYNLTLTLQDFATFPTSTKISEMYASRADFPAVTFCNLNRARFNEFNKTGLWSTLLDTWEKEQKNLTERMSDLDSTMRGKESGEARELAHRIENMTVDCTFNSQTCTATDFDPSDNDRYGACYTFNTGGAAKRFTTRPGIDYGLSLELDVESYDYLPYTVTNGIMVLVHEPGTTPFPEDEGIIVGTGAATSIGLRRVEMTRASYPHGVCIDVDDTEVTQLNMFGEGYSTPACRKTCYQEHVFRYCGCCDQQFPCVEDTLLKITGETSSNSIRPCNLTDSFEKGCLTQTLRDFEGGSLGCTDRCPPPCYETIYEKVVSTGAWPSDSYSSTFIDQVNGLRASRGQPVYREFTKDPAFVRSNFLRLVVYYEALTYQVFESQPLYDWARLVSDIGGQLGLWLGFSLLTAAEWLELLYDLIAKVGRKVCGKTPVKHLDRMD